MTQSSSPTKKNSKSLMNKFCFAKVINQLHNFCFTMSCFQIFKTTMSGFMTWIFLYRRLFTPGTGPNKHYNCIYKRLIIYLSNNCSHTRQSRVFLLIIKLHVCHPKFPFKQSVCYVKIKQNGYYITRMRFLHRQKIEWYTEVLLYKDTFFIKTVVETQTSDNQFSYIKMEEKNTYLYVLLLLNIIAVSSYCKYAIRCLMYLSNK